MGEWFETELARLCSSIDYGYTASANEKPVGPKFLRITDIVNSHLVWEQVPFASISDSDHRKYKLSSGDIVIARTGATTGVSKYIKNPPDAIFASYLVRLKVNEKADSEFISYWLQSPAFWDYLRGVLGDKSAQPNASASTMAKARVRLPRSLPEQRAIASVLSALDDKIELNRRMNQTLEGMARALFADWFVHFGPTRAKMAVTEPYLAPEIWSLFPDRLDENGLPEGWEMGTLADIAQSPRRGVKPADVAENTPYIGLEHMPRRSIALSDWDGAEKVSSNKSRFYKGEFLFGKLRPYFHKVGVAAVDGICSTDIVVVTPKAEEWAALTLACISSDDFVEYTNAGSTGTKMPRTSWKIMAAYKLCIPPREVAQAYQEIVWPMIEKIIDNIHQSRTLAQTRDLLLPKLMSGEIRVREAERVKGNVVPFAINLFGEPTLTEEERQEQDAAIVASIIKGFGNNGAQIVGNVRYQKGVYFVRRRMEMPVQDYQKKAAGPYSPELRYEGGYKVACERRYIRQTTKGGYEGNVPAENIGQVNALLEKYGLKDAVDWVIAKFAGKDAKSLGLLATVDHILNERKAKGLSTTVSDVRTALAADPDWQHKLSEAEFSEKRINEAIREIEALF